MKDLSCHILDIVQNSLHAGADRIEILLSENSTAGILCLTIKDNGCGMKEEVKQRVTDPFYTTGMNKKVGLGLPLLKQNAEQTGGRLSIDSEEGKGTTVKAAFHSDHMDMIPLGDMASTMKSLIASYPELDFVYAHSCGRKEFSLDTAEIRSELEGVTLNTREVLDFLVNYIRSNLEELKKEDRDEVNI
jgi:hypothetical protein